MKEALFVVSVEVDASFAEEWNAFHKNEHVPLVVKTAGFSGAQRFRVVAPDGIAVDPPRFVTVYRASGLGVVRAYLEGGAVGTMRDHMAAFLGTRRMVVTREILEENYAVGADGVAKARADDAPSARAALVIRVRVEPESVASWSVWYDREHMPAVARAGFLRATRYRVVDDAGGGATRFAIVYEAPTLDAVLSYRSGAGARFAQEHEAAWGTKCSIERALWSLVG